MEYSSRTRRSSPEFSSSRASTASRGYGSGLSSGYETGPLHSPVSKKYSSHISKEMNGFTETRRSGRPEGRGSTYGSKKEETNYPSISSPYRCSGSPTFHDIKSPASPAFSSSRRYRSVDRDFDQHDHLDRTRSSSSPTNSSVWLSKKMKEVSQNGFKESDQKHGDKQRSYSPLSNSRYERSKSDLEPQSTRRLHSFDSPSDSVNSRRETPHYICADRDLLSPRDSIISRNSDFRSRASPSKDYKSMNEFSNTNLRSPDMYPQTSPSHLTNSDSSKFLTELYQQRDRSNSFHDLREPSSVLKDIPKSRFRHKTLAYGVSGHDLERARSGHTTQGSNARSGHTRQGSDVRSGHTRQGSDEEDMQKILRELEDTGFFNKNHFSSSAHISSCLPHISNTTQQPSFSSVNSSINFYPPATSPNYQSPKKSSKQSNKTPNISPQNFIHLMSTPNSMPNSYSKVSTPTSFSYQHHIQQGPPTTLPLPHTISSSSLPPYSHPIQPNPIHINRSKDISSVQDDALIVLKKHDLDALLAEQRQKEYIVRIRKLRYSIIGECILLVKSLM